MYCDMFGSVTYIDDSLQAIRTGQIPQVPVLLGSMQDDGTIFAPSFPNISVFLGYEFGRLSFYRPPNMTAVMALYPGLNDTQLLDAVVRDVLFRWYALRLW
jgi:carboxylesterase type B